MATEESIIWREIKNLIPNLIPYVFLGVLGYLVLNMGQAMLVQQDRVLHDNLKMIHEEIIQQRTVLADMRDQLRTHGIVVPPFRLEPEDD